MGQQERVEKAAERRPDPAEHDQQDSDSARLFVRDDIAATWWPKEQ